MKGLLLLLLSLMESDDFFSQVFAIAYELVRAIDLAVQDDTPDVSQVNYPIAARGPDLGQFNQVLDSRDRLSGRHQFFVAVAPLIVSHQDADLLTAFARQVVETQEPGGFSILAERLPDNHYLVLCVYSRVPHALVE